MIIMNSEEFNSTVVIWQKDGPGAPGGQSWTVQWLKFDNSYFKVWNQNNLYYYLRKEDLGV